MIERLKEYYIDNSTGLDQTITLKKSTACNSGGIDTFEDVDGFSQIAPTGVETQILFPGDGIYQVYLDNVLEDTANYQMSLFSSAIVYVSASLCGNLGPNCVSVTQCTETAPNYLNNAISKLMLYTSLYNPKYDDAVIASLQSIRCSAIDIQEMIIKQEQYLGVSSTEDLLKVELAHLYLEMYKVDAALDAGYISELDELYNYDKISYCIKRLGVTDCAPPLPPPGIEHEVEFYISPTTMGLGTSTDITVSYKFTANDDIFVSVIDSNPTGISVGEFDGFTHSKIDNTTVAENYLINYSYTRGGITYQNTVTAKPTAYTPQWFGGESATADFASGTSATTIDNSFANISTVYQSTSNKTTSNTNTVDKYIWWITKNEVQFFIGAFEIITGPWAAPCDPNSYAIIHKTITVTMEDGVTTDTLHLYRTCPLQDLTGQTLTYELKQ